MSEKTLTLPDLGEGLTEAEIVRWLVAEGDEVAVDQPVVEVETAKTVVEVPSPYAGRVTVLHGHAGETLAVGSPLISFEAPASKERRGGTRRKDAAPRQVPSNDTSIGDGGSGSVLVGSGTAPSAVAGRRLRPRAAQAAPLVNGSTTLVASPVVRRLARDLGVDVKTLHGTGDGGVVTRRDVERARSSAASTSTATSGRRTPLTGFQRAAAANFGRSRAEIPEATVWVDVDATALVKLRESGRRPEDPGPGVLAYLAGFVVAALRDYPVFNARFDAQRQEIVESEHINLGIAAAGSRGLVVPVIRGAESMSVSTLDQQIDEALSRAQRGTVTAAELAEGTFTLNNYGRLGVDGSAAIINHPQVAILGVGRILDRPWVVQGRIRPRKIAQLSFVFDHRVGDGTTAAGFLRCVADAIENPVRALARR